MSTTEDVARLKLENDDGPFVSAIQREERALEALQMELRAGAITVDEFDRRSDELVKSLEMLRGAQDEAASSADRVAKAHGRAASEAGRAARGTADIGRAALEGSRALEDLQYGIGGVVNNIPSLTMALGGGAGLTAAISLVAVGIAQLVKHWPEFMGLFTDRTAVPEAVGDLDRYQGALNKVNDSLQELRKQTSLSFDELERFKKLTAEQADLEAKVAQARLTEANRKAHGENASQADRERASGFGKALDEAGGFEKIVERFVQADMIRTKSDESERAGFRRAWEEVFNNALKGQEKAIGIITSAAQLDKTGMTGIFDKDIERYSPERKYEADRKKRARQVQDEADEFDAEADRVYKLQTKQANDKLVAALNKQGAEGEKIARDQLREMDKEKKGEAEQTKATVTRQIKGEDANAKERGYDVLAQRELARLRAQGGEFDQAGRFHKMDEGQIFDLVEKRLDALLKQRNPYMMDDQRRSIAARTTSLANQELERVVGLNGTLVENQAALANRYQELNAKVAVLMTRSREVGRAIKAPSPTNLPMGVQ
jgi:uncharacterized protein (UPF0335 family)